MREGDEATSGDHGEAVLSAVDMIGVWGILVLIAVTLGDLKLAGWLPVDWIVVSAPAWCPLLVLVIVLLVALSSDLLRAARARRA